MHMEKEDIVLYALTYIRVYWENVPYNCNVLPDYKAVTFFVCD
jgi:hypothetical protein